MALFKNIYDKAFFDVLSSSLEAVMPCFDKKAFLQNIFDAEWGQRELKQRMRHISSVLKNHLSSNYPQSLEQLIALIEHLKNKGIFEKSLEFMFIPDFVEQYGTEHFDTSVSAFEQISEFTSCEFAVRPFIVKYEKMMMSQMQAWARHSHHKVRRLASEGCRPRLPWAMALPQLKKNPSPILPILEVLKTDSSAFVRRSVANNLNDISKDHPDIVMSLAAKWRNVAPETDWIVKRGCRTLLKQGNKEMMQLFGFGSVEKLEIDHFQFTSEQVRIGEHLEFEFQLANGSKKVAKIRLEYGIYYKKANGSLSKKVFKISEKQYSGNSKSPIRRKHSFKPITTRKFYPGIHKLSLIVNGYELQEKEFELKK